MKDNTELLIQALENLEAQINILEKKMDILCVKQDLIFAKITHTQNGNKTSEERK